MIPQKSQGLIVFDMDGVLIDVSASYRDVVRQTVRMFFQPAPASSKLPDPLFSLVDLAHIKQSGGFNNDWDLTCFILELLFSLVEKPLADETLSDWERYRFVVSRCHLENLIEFLKSHKNPLTFLQEKHPKSQDPFIRSLSTGDVGSGNIIKQIFQEFYLGRGLFEAAYGRQAQVHFQEGFIHREWLMVEKVMLETLAADHLLAIATGRPKLEADFALDHHGIREYFDFVYTLDDCIEEEKRILEQEGRRVSLSKPDPFMLDAIAALLQVKPVVSYYVGDMPDDMIAAARSRSGFVGVGLVASSPDKQSLRSGLLRAGADYIIEDIAKLEEIVSV